MLWAIVTSEILPTWTLNHRLAAMTIRDLYNKGKGGFVLPPPVNMFTKQEIRSHGDSEGFEGVLFVEGEEGD